MSFAESLKTARKRAGLTQQGMAGRMEIPRRTIQDWEGGKMIPPSYVQRLVLNELETLLTKDTEMIRKEEHNENNVRSNGRQV
jgi:transcriptional regulator with XRE-family HTH domain